MFRSPSFRLALAALVLLGAAACSPLTAPPSPAHDDPSTCANGFTIISGVVVCNP